jgi:uncharacterized membrane protein
MSTTRLEAYSDAVIAIVVTIMVLELRPPHGSDLAALSEQLPSFLAYILSFIYLSIYWNNHHHLMHVTERVNGGILWGNIHLLFWLSLIPFTTSWLSENPGEVVPSVFYGANLFMAGLAYFILRLALRAGHNPSSQLMVLTESSTKENLSTGLYIVAIIISLYGQVWIAYGIYAIVAFLWVIPDKRFEAVEN